MIPISDLAAEFAKLLNFKPRRIRHARVAKMDGKLYSKYSPAHLRKIRAKNGVGRPPAVTLARLAQ